MKSKHGAEEFFTRFWMTVAFAAGASIIGTVVSVVSKMTHETATWTIFGVVFLSCLMLGYGVHLAAQSLNIIEDMNPSDLRETAERTRQLAEASTRLNANVERVLTLTEQANSVIIELYVSHRSVQMIEDDEGNFRSSKPVAVMIYARVPRAAVHPSSTAILGFEHTTEIKYGLSYPVGVLPTENFSHRRKATVPVMPGITHVLLPSFEIPKDKVDAFKNSDNMLVVTLDCENPMCHLRDTIRIEGFEDQ